MSALIERLKKKLGVDIKIDSNPWSKINNGAVLVVSNDRFAAHSTIPCELINNEEALTYEVLLLIKEYFGGEKLTKH